MTPVYILNFYNNLIDRKFQISILNRKVAHYSLVFANEEKKIAEFSLLFEDNIEESLYLDWNTFNFSIVLSSNVKPLFEINLEQEEVPETIKYNKVLFKLYEDMTDLVTEKDRKYCKDIGTDVRVVYYHAKNHKFDLVVLYFFSNGKEFWTISRKLKNVDIKYGVE